MAVVMEILNSGVQAQKFLRTFPLFKSLFWSFLTPCGTVRMLDHVVTAGGGNYPLMVDALQAQDLPDHSAVAAEMIGKNHLQDVVFIQQLCQDVLYRFGVPGPLEHDVEHEAVLVHGSP